MLRLQDPEHRVLTVLPARVHGDGRRFSDNDNVRVREEDRYRVRHYRGLVAVHEMDHGLALREVIAGRDFAAVDLQAPVLDGLHLRIRGRVTRVSGG